MTLPAQAKLVTWPTPQSRDEKGETQNAHRMDAVPNVLKASWPTPNAKDESQHRNKTANRSNPNSTHHDGQTLTDAASVLGKTPYGCLAQTESFVVRLTTLSAWLMGYTAHYLQHWEIRSARKSRSKSLKPSDAK